jgi:hypothetical protein
MVASADGNIRLDNTFEGRMERSAESLQRSVAERLAPRAGRSSMGRVIEINGPLVTIELADVRTGEEVHVGSMNLSGEVIGRNGARALVQVYEPEARVSRRTGRRALSTISSQDLAPLLIDQAESRRPRRPVEARGLANGLGRVGGAQVDLLQDRRAAFSREAQSPALMVAFDPKLPDCGAV